MIMRCAHGGRRRRWIALLAFCWWLCAGILPAAAADDAAFAAQLHAMQVGEFAEKDAAVQMLEGLKDERALPVLKALLAGHLYYRKVDDRIVFVKETPDCYQLGDVKTGESLGWTGLRDGKKIAINNALRGQLLGAIARLS